MNRHIRQEEKEIFPRARRSRGEFQPLLDALTTRAEGEARLPAPLAAAGHLEAPSRRTARGRQGRGRARENAAAEADSGATASEQVEADVEQPRQGRGEAEESGETETIGHAREQESIEQEGHESRR